MKERAAHHHSHHARGGTIRPLTALQQRPTCLPLLPPPTSGQPVGIGMVMTEKLPCFSRRARFFLMIRWSSVFFAGGVGGEEA